MHISNLKDKKVAVWGLGREGLAVLRLLRKHYPDQPITVLNDSDLSAQALAEIGKVSADNRRPPAASPRSYPCAYFLP